MGGNDSREGFWIFVIADINAFINSRNKHCYLPNKKAEIANIYVQPMVTTYTSGVAAPFTC